MSYDFLVTLSMGQKCKFYCLFLCDETHFLLQDLIETIVGLQHRIEHQARKQSDLEDYIDTLLMKVLATAPCLLQKDASLASETFGLKLSHSIK